ncbi:hypothetical protein COT72_01145 [archaeon CG10_big_fil_rev_8_21_14_0_10_43_11]|nr:MAG: hypothetical protein COT72_01145 [archaeon CG10_big_fil_rev_8_21_14_0_10_43_11]
MGLLDFLKRGKKEDEFNLGASSNDLGLGNNELPPLPEQESIGLSAPPALPETSRNPDMLSSGISQNPTVSQARRIEPLAQAPQPSQGDAGSQLLDARIEALKAKIEVVDHKLDLIISKIDRMY